MACSFTLWPSSHATSVASSPLKPFSHTAIFPYKINTISRKTSKFRKLLTVSASASSSALEALIFDCDGVILESEHLHRQAYNDAFTHFNVRCSGSPQLLNWGLDFYDVLQNRIGGGKPKMRWFFLILLHLRHTEN